MGDAADHLDLAEVLLDFRGRLVFDVVQVHDFVLDVEVEFPPQKAAQVLVDEVVESVPGGVLREMLLKTVRSLFLSVGAGLREFLPSIRSKPGVLRMR